MTRTLPRHPQTRGQSCAAGKETLVLLVCGEALIDLVGQPDGRYLARPGGGPANTAVTLGRLGVPGALAARLSQDAFGEQIRVHLEQSDVDLGLARSVEEPTTLAVATL